MKRLVRNNCTGCHTPSFILQHKFDEAGWNAIIELMKNANVYGTSWVKSASPPAFSTITKRNWRLTSPARAVPAKALDEVQAAVRGPPGKRHG